MPGTRPTRPALTRPRAAQARAPCSRRQPCRAPPPPPPSASSPPRPPASRACIQLCGTERRGTHGRARRVDAATTKGGMGAPTALTAATHIARRRCCAAASRKARTSAYIHVGLRSRLSTDHHLTPHGDNRDRCTYVGRVACHVYYANAVRYQFVMCVVALMPQRLRGCVRLFHLCRVLSFHDHVAVRYTGIRIGSPYANACTVHRPATDGP